MNGLIAIVFLINNTIKNPPFLFTYASISPRLVLLLVKSRYYQRLKEIIFHEENQIINGGMKR